MSEDDGMPAVPMEAADIERAQERVRKTSGQQLRVWLNGEEATEFVHNARAQRADTAAILGMLKGQVLPQLEHVGGEVESLRSEMQNHVAVLHNRVGALTQRVDGVEKLVDASEKRVDGVEKLVPPRRPVAPLVIFIGIVLAFAIGGSLARTYDALVLPHLGASEHARPDHHANDIPDLDR